MTSRLREKVAIVTGAGGGLGRAISIALAQEGAAIVLGGRSLSSLEDTANEIRAVSGTAEVQACDVSDEKSVEDLVEFAMKQRGKLDILVNSAGVLVRKPALETSGAEWRHSLDINLSGTWYACIAAAKRMLPRGGGKIVNIASTAGAKGRAGITAYCAGKAGIINLTRALAVEWARNGIYVNAIAPGQFETDMGGPALSTPAGRQEVLNRVPLARIGQPREIGPLAVYLCSGDSDMVTGETIFIDGGVNAL